MKLTKHTTTFTALALSLATSTAVLAAGVTLLTVSYDPTRELYTVFNKSFAA
jgi:sulfate transport system substrate-binding protein